MRYRPEHKQQVRRRILTWAGRLFRRHGYEGVGIDAIMAAADLTENPTTSAVLNVAASLRISPAIPAGRIRRETGATGNFRGECGSMCGGCLGEGGGRGKAWHGPAQAIAGYQ